MRDLMKQKGLSNLPGRLQHSDAELIRYCQNGICIVFKTRMPSFEPTVAWCADTLLLVAFSV